MPSQWFVLIGRLGLDVMRSSDDDAGGRLVSGWFFI
jgi:hypothetical protein